MNYGTPLSKDACIRIRMFQKRIKSYVHSKRQWLPVGLMDRWTDRQTFLELRRRIQKALDRKMIQIKR